jgi:hypothetical protein
MQARLFLDLRLTRSQDRLQIPSLLSLISSLDSLGNHCVITRSTGPFKSPRFPALHCGYSPTLYRGSGFQTFRCRNAQINGTHDIPIHAPFSDLFPFRLFDGPCDRSPCNPSYNSHRGFGVRGFKMHELLVHEISDIPIDKMPTMPILCHLSSSFAVMTAGSHYASVLLRCCADSCSPLIGVSQIAISQCINHLSTGSPISQWLQLRWCYMIATHPSNGRS